MNSLEARKSQIKSLGEDFVQIKDLVQKLTHNEVKTECKWYRCKLSDQAIQLIDSAVYTLQCLKESIQVTRVEAAQLLKLSAEQEQ